MPSSNILLFDANKANMMADEQYKTNTQRLNGVQSGIASSQLQNKTLYQVSLVAYAIAQIMNQNGRDANDTAAVSAFVSNLSGTILQKVADLATTQQAQAGAVNNKWMSPALVKVAINALAAKAQNILSAETKTAFGLGSTAVPDDIFQILANAALYKNGNLSLPNGVVVPNLKVELGSYVGDGATTKSLTFSGTPQLLVVNGNGAPNYPSSMVVPRGAEGCFVGGGGSSFIFGIVNIIWDNMTVSWSEDTAHSNVSALNESNKTYHYLALCT